MCHFSLSFLGPLLSSPSSSVRADHVPSPGSWSPSLRGPAFVVNAGTGHFEVLGSISQTKGHDEVANPVINREQLGGAFMRIGLMPSSRWDAAVQVAQGVDVGKRAKPRWPYCKAAGRRLASKWLAHRVMYMSPNVKGAMGAGIGAGGALVGWRALREWQKKEAREEARRAGERIVQGPRPGAPAAAAAIEMSAVRLAEQGTSHGAAGKVAAEKVATDQAAPGKVGSFKMTLAEAEAEAKHGGKAKIEQID